MKYNDFPLALTDTQLEKILRAAKNHEGTVIRLTTNNIQENAPHKIPLTKTQIEKIIKTKHGFNLKLSAAQLKYLEKSGGFLPLLALLPLIFGGLAAAGGVAGGVATAVSSAKNIQAAAAAQSELERHNRQIEAELKDGTGINGVGGIMGGAGIISDKIQNVPILGKLVPYLKKIGLGDRDCLNILKGNCVYTNGIGVKQMGNGIFLGPTGDGLFLGKQ